MERKRTHYGCRIRRPGFTIVECLVGLAISAILMAAIAAALNASAVNCRENENMFRTVNNARQALTRMTSEIRTAGYLAADGITWYGVRHNATPGNQCRLYMPTQELITYEFRSADQRLYLIKNATGQEYLLCDNVTAATFATTSDNGNDATSVEISLTVQEGGFPRTLSAAAVPRRNPPAL